MLNKVMCIGNLARDPEVKYSQSGKAICSLNVGASESYTDRDGNRQTKTEWFRVSAFDKLAENCGKYLKKGSLVYVEGKLTTREYTDKDGVKKYSTEVRADTVRFLDRKEKGQQEGAQRPQNSQQNQYAAPSEYAGMDSDLPF